jgi:hypothetical protein
MKLKIINYKNNECIRELEDLTQAQIFAYICASEIIIDGITYYSKIYINGLHEQYFDADKDLYIIYVYPRIV